MNSQILQQLGLTKPQARAYIALIKHGMSTPTRIADEIGESRTNTYMILDKLVELDLAIKEERNKKVHYAPSNPIALEKLAEKKRNESHLYEKMVRDSMPQLLNYFHTYQNKPGIRFFQGKEGILKIYEDQRRTGEDIYFIRSSDDINVLGDKLYDHIERRAKLKIKTFGIEPAVRNDIAFASVHDKRLLRDMTWLPAELYSAPVNIMIYGNKVALISYGEEIIGTIIESPQISTAMKQIFSLVKIAAKAEYKQPRKNGK